MVETFDGWDRDYVELENEENPFRLLVLAFKFMFKVWWKIFKFVMIQLRNVILWLMKKQRIQGRPQAVLYPAYQN